MPSRRQPAKEDAHAAWRDKQRCRRTGECGRSRSLRILSKVDGDAGVLILRGHYLQEIAGHRSFEWVTGLFWQDFVDRPVALGPARVHAFEHLQDLLPVAGTLPPLAAVRLALEACRMMPDDAPQES